MPLVRQFFFIAILTICQVYLRAGEYEPFRVDGKYGIKDVTSGEVLIPPQYEAIGWSDGTFEVINNVIGARQNEKWALIDLEGRKVSLHRYARLTPYLENLFIVSERESNSILANFGVINAKGKSVIDMSYVRMEPAGNLLIAAKRVGSDDRYGLLNRNGKSIIPFTFKNILAIDEALFSVQNDDKLSAVYTSNGKPITAFEYESLEKLTSELLLAKSFNKRGILNRRGDLIVPTIYKNIQISGQKVRALPFKKWDLYSDNSLDTSYYFDQMQIINQDRFAVSSGQKVGIIDQDENYIEYLSNLNILSSVNEITIVENVDSKFQGAMDASGKLVLPVNYDSIIVLNEVIIGQIKRLDKQDWTVFNKSGTRQSPFQYESFKQLDNGLIKAVRNGKKGLLHEYGKDLSPFVYDSIGEFKNGLTVVAYQGSYGVINMKGNWVITPYNDHIEIQEDIIRLRQGSEWKLVDFSGKEIVRSYGLLNKLPQGYSKWTKNGYELKDDKDSLWLDRLYDTIQVVRKDLYGLKRDDRYFLFNPNNTDDIALDSGITVLGEFSEGLILVKKDDQWGQIAQDGKLRIANRYEAIQAFSEQLCAVKLIGKWGFIDKNEQLIVQPTYDQVSPFYKGLSVVLRNGLFGIIDHSGKSILAEDFTSIDRQEDHIILNSNGVFGLADAKGKLIRTPQYDSIKALEDGYFLIGRDGLKGVINLNGEDVIPLSYESIQQLGNRFLASEASQWKLIDLK